MAIVDVDVMSAIAAERKPVCGVRSVADLLDIEHNDELAAQLRRLVEEELLNRYMLNNQFFYSVTTKGHEYLAAQGIDASKLPAPKRKVNSNPIPVARMAPATRPAGAEAQKSARRKHGADVAAIAAEIKNEPLEVTTMTTREEQNERRDALAKTIEKSGNWHALKDLAKSAGVPPKIARRLLGELVEAKRIQAHGATSNKRWGQLGLQPDSEGDSAPPAASKRKPKAKKAPAKKKARSRTVRMRPPYEREAREFKAPRGAGKNPDKDHVLVAAASAPGSSVASFTAKGEIVVTAPGVLKQLSVDESREVIGLVRAFDNAGLLPKAA